MIRYYLDKIVKTLRKLPDEATHESLLEAYNDTIHYLNLTLPNMSLQANFNCTISSLKIPPSSNIKIQHFLGIVPKYRLILRQEGNGVISDIPSGWTNKEIELRNNGSVEVSITVMIIRE